MAITFEKHSETKTIVRIYYDGVYESSQIINSSLVFSESDSAWYLGAAKDQSGNIVDTMSGWLDNVAFWRGVLSKYEIGKIIEDGYVSEVDYTDSAEWTQYTYSDDGRYVIKEENSQGTTVNYDINSETGLTQSTITTTREGVSVRMNYEYNLDKTLKMVYYDINENGQRESYETYTGYTYDSRGNLASVAHNGTTYTFTNNEWGQRTSTAIGDNVLATYSYPTVNDKAINATQTSMSYGGEASKTKEYIYNKEGQLVGRKFGGVQTQKWAYDNNGNPVYERDFEDSTTTRNQYDAKSRLVQQYKNLLSGTYVSNYQYDTDSNLTKAAYHLFGNGPTYSVTSSYEYDDDDRFTTAISGDVKTTASYDEDTDEYTKRAALVKQTDGTYDEIASESYTYFKRSGTNAVNKALSSITYEDNTSVSYEYDSQGRITAEKRNGTLYASYTYDALGQLTSADYPTLHVRYNYVYDNAGNLTEAHGLSLDSNGNLLGCFDSKTLSYGVGDWGDAIIYDGNNVCTYDAMGNPLSAFGKTFTWENGRELASVSQNGSVLASYEYDSAGLRISKTTTAGGTVYYAYDESNNLIFERHSDYTLIFYYNGNGIRTHFDYKTSSSSATYFYRYNLQGDVTAILNSSGTIVASYDYNPYGDSLYSACVTTSEIGNLNPFRYRGYYYDAETGYYYLQSRYYNPKFCRFINADELIDNGAGIFGYNMYAYCLNNPVNYEDSDGEMAAAAGALAWGVAAGGANAWNPAGWIILGATAIAAIGILVIPWDSVGQSISNGWNKVKSSARSASISRSISKAVSKAKTKIRNEKRRYDYWIAAYVEYDDGRGAYIPTTPLSYTRAISYVRGGGSVFADSRNNAYKLAKAVGGGTPARDPAHGGLGYWRHYHATRGDRRIGGHVFYVA